MKSFSSIIDVVFSTVRYTSWLGQFKALQLTHGRAQRSELPMID